MKVPMTLEIVGGNAYLAIFLPTPWGCPWPTVIYCVSYYLQFNDKGLHVHSEPLTINIWGCKMFFLSILTSPCYLNASNNHTTEIHDQSYLHWKPVNLYPCGLAQHAVVTTSNQICLSVPDFSSIMMQSHW